METKVKGITITVPGSAWEEALNPLASAMQADLGLPKPRWRKVGKGSQAIYENVSPEVARETAAHLSDMGELWLANSDPEYDARERGVYRGMIRAAAKILKAIEEQT